MNQFEKTQRDALRDSKQALEYKGYVFPVYEGRITGEEFYSKQVFYAFWGDQYLTARAVRYHVDQLIEHNRLPIAA
ncbi:MAG: hypothetical protein GY815_05675 [Gammaproteobacteria bacterium]|nr:hypothetical protein [Gammaproteobacteria bacterium]